MVDEGRVVRLLRGISERTARLRAAAAIEERDELWLDAVKYLFVTAIEGCIDVAQHVATSDGFGAPDSNAGALRLLGRHGVLAPDLAASMARAVGFRNVLVHQYAEVDDSIVVAAIDDRLDDLDEFVSTVGEWLTDQRR